MYIIKYTISLNSHKIFQLYLTRQL